MAFKEVDHKKKVAEREKEVLAFWDEHDTFQKSMDRPDAESYTFYDGPPFATGLPHYGHIVASTLKDVVPRYWTMRGKRVERTWGWDCHGLPIENIVEKELGSKSKKDIEEMGVAKFNELCRSKVLEYADEWEKIVPRLGRWVDMSNPYRTMDKNYMESVWWVFKQLFDKGLIYEDYRSMHICPRCETTLSQSEVTEGYQDVKDLSVTAKFKVQKGQEIAGETVDDNTYILAWTTTPWTLAGNVALAVGDEIGYTKIKITSTDDENDVFNSEVSVGDSFILAKDTNLINLFVKDNFRKDAWRVADKEKSNVVVSEKSFLHFSFENIKGSDLINLSYEPLYDAYASDEKLENKENGWKVYAADFVTTEDGTGVVHIAPAFGEDDMNLGRTENLPFVQHVGMDGVIADEVGAPLAGLHVKPKDNVQATDIEVIKDLAHRGLLFHKEKYEHSYPHCWRCDTPLINYATSSWFVAVTKIKEQLLANAKDINWSPAHIKEGRFGKWLEGARDWSISRQRFWASVMPIWACDGCDEMRVFGSADELEEASGQKVDDLHKHIVDEITFDCKKCTQSTSSGQVGTMKRVPDVLDTWFDSGSMPYAQMHYPFENKEKFTKGFPADFIAEGVDQTRAWFYYQHVLAGAIMEKPAFQNVIVNGIVLAEDGKKMSKKLQNYPDPMEVVEKYGADALRLYLISSPVVAADNLAFSEKGVAELTRGLFRMLRQSYSFFVMYAHVDGWSPHVDSEKLTVKSENILDQWIVARLHELIRDVNNHMETYELHKATRALTPFIDDLSNWYIRRSRKRFWKSEDDDDKNTAYATLYYVLVELAKVMAPFTPFISEEIYRNLVSPHPNPLPEGEGGVSVHLADFPQADEKLIDGELITQMTAVRDVITKGLELRAQAGIKVRQPLSELKVKSKKLQEEFFEVIKDEVNVKNVTLDSRLRGNDTGEFVSLDTKITPELKLEGQAREIIRYIQQGRKKAGFDVDDRITLSYEGMENVFKEHGELIAHEVLATDVQSELLAESDYEETVKIDDEELVLSLKK